MSGKEENQGLMNQFDGATYTNRKFMAGNKTLV